jgi:N-acetylmuramoyl-L-alanine amidase
MNITSDHWLEGIRREVISGGSPMNIRRFLVLHHTAGATGLSSINFWRTPEARGASAHIVIDRDGTIYQCRPFNRTCGHAGVSKWRGYEGLNSCSIGIELANAGDNPTLAKRWSKLPLVKAKHKNGGPEKEWEAYPEAQMKSLIEVSRAITKRYNMDPDSDVAGHDQIAPSRKVDPGPAFQWDTFRAALKAGC